MSQNHSAEIINEILDLTRRLNDATWAAAHICNTAATFEITTLDDGREILRPIFTTHPAPLHSTPISSPPSLAREALR